MQTHQRQSNTQRSDVPAVGHGAIASNRRQGQRLAVFRPAHPVARRTDRVRATVQCILQPMLQPVVESIGKSIFVRDS